MVWFLSFALFITPILVKFFDNFSGKLFSKPLKPIYVFLIILNFAITFLVSANLAIFMFFVIWIYGITISIFIFYIFRFWKSWKNVKITYNDFYKKINVFFALKQTIKEISSLLFFTIIFILITLFSSEKFGDTGAYINLSNNFKNGIFSFDRNDDKLGNIFSWNSVFGPYQYSGVYYAYSAWSIYGNVIPYYTFLSPLIYWILLSWSLNETILFFFKKQLGWYFVISIFTYIFSLFLILFNFYWISASNNSHFEILLILLIYEILVSFRKKINISNLFYPLISLSFFSITGYLFYLPIGLAILFISLYRLDIKCFFQNLIFLFFVIFLYISMLKFIWLGFILSILLFLLFYYLSFKYWYKIELFLINILSFFKIYKMYDFYNLKRKNSILNKKSYWFTLIIKALFLISFLLFGLYIALDNSKYYNLSSLRIALLILSTIWLFFCNKKFKDNNNWINMGLFIYVLWFISELIAKLSSIFINNPSIWRFLYLSGNFWMTFIPYIYFSMITLFILLKVKYVNLKLIGKINLKSLSISIMILLNISILIICLYLRIQNNINFNISNIYDLVHFFSLNVNQNIFKWN